MSKRNVEASKVPKTRTAFREVWVSIPSIMWRCRPSNHGFARGEECFGIGASFPAGIAVGIADIVAFSDGTVCRNTRDGPRQVRGAPSQVPRDASFHDWHDKAKSRLNRKHKRLRTRGKASRY